MTNLILGPIIGGLTDTETYIWGRTDGPATLYAWIGQKPDLSDLTQPTAKSLPLAAESGFAGIVPINGLQPETEYYYTVTLDDTLDNPLVYPYPKFSTFPEDREARSFSFVFGSCFLPKDKTGGAIFDRISGLRALRASEPDKDLRFLLLTGDQIYADAYGRNGLSCCALSLDEYRQVYAYTWSRPPFQKLLQKIPAFMTLDDHEVDDDWTWTDLARTKARLPIWDAVIRWWHGRPKEERELTPERVKNALQAYWEHQGMHARGYHSPLALDEEYRYTLAASDRGSLAYSFTYGAAAFLVLDTRSMRVRVKNGSQIMLGEGQWQVLEDWLDEVKEKYPVKFIVTSCAMLYQLRFDIPKDRWTGFEDERDQFIRELEKRDLDGVYLLAGDLHSAHAMEVQISGKSGLIPLWEFCATPFEQDPNKLARYDWMRKPLPEDLVASQELHFTYNQHNFGVVEVIFDDSQKPKVRFEIYGPDGRLKEFVETGGD
jgi:alkaline phosphatase D